MTKLKSIFLLTGASLLTTAMPAFAQDADGPGVEEPTAAGDIVVTAQRREQSLQDVPIAISAIGEESLERQAVVSTGGLLRLFPNVSGAQITGAGANNYSIRGLSNAATSATFDGPVGTYVDGIYMARTNSNNFGLFDVERIEVMRGPQGTLFGRNTTGGAINIVMKKPDDEFGASFEGSYGSFDRKQLRASVDMPISESVRTRVAGYWTDEDGWVKNLTTGGNNNAHKGWGVRGAVEVDISPSVTWEGAVDYIEDSNANLPVSRVDGDWVSYSGLQPLGDIVTGTKGENKGNVFENSTVGLTSRFTIDSDLGVISIITGYRDLTSRYNIDYFDAPRPVGGYNAVQYSTHEQFTQEMNVSGTAFNGVVDYTVGLFYFQEKNMQDVTEVFILGSGFPFIAGDRTIKNDTSSFAGYGQFDIHLTDSFYVTAGARITSDDKDIRYFDNGNPLAVGEFTTQTLVDLGVPLQQRTTVVTPRFVLNYEPREDFLLFASATKGFKSGGWNTGTTPAELGIFTEEQIWSFEGGMRSQFFDKKVAFNLTGFYGYTKDLQLPTAVATAGGAPAFPTGNFADFRSYGVEAELTYRPVRALNLFANAGYNKTEYANPSDAALAQQANCLSDLSGGATTSSYCGAGIVRADGEFAKPFRAPEFTGTAGFSYEFPVSDDWNLVPAGSVRYVSSFNVNSAELPITEDDGYTLVAGTLSLEKWDRSMKVSVGCENCTDTNYLVSVIAGYYYYSPPRRWTATVGFKF